MERQKAKTMSCLTKPQAPSEHVQMLFEKLKPFDDMKKRYRIESDRITATEKKVKAAFAAFVRGIEAESKEREAKAKTTPN